MVTAAAPFPLLCRCGTVRGVALDVSPGTGSRLFCYCDDCQAFGDFLDQPGVLDARGGTDVFHTAPSRVRITEGAAQLRCMRLSDKGLYRWYTGCCKTPIGNMISPRFPFVGLIHSFMDHAGDGRTREEVLGKPRVYLFPECAVGGLPAELQPRSPLGVLARSVRMLPRWWREGRRTPSPFFAKGIVPLVLSAPEREALRKRAPERARRAAAGEPLPG